MRGKLRQRKLYTGKISLYIDYYPPVWNPVKKIYSRREYLKLFLHPNPKTSFEKRQNELNKELAEKIFLKRMKSFMLEENQIFNKDILESDFYIYANDFIKAKERSGTNMEHHKSAIKYLKKFSGDHCKFRHIDANFLKRFKDFCLQPQRLNQSGLHWAPIQHPPILTRCSLLWKRHL